MASLLFNFTRPFVFITGHQSESIQNSSRHNLTISLLTLIGQTILCAFIIWTFPPSNRAWQSSWSWHIQHVNIPPLILVMHVGSRVSTYELACQSHCGAVAALFRERQLESDVKDEERRRTTCVGKQHKLLHVRLRSALWLPKRPKFD